MQESFSYLWDNYESDDAAKAARDARYKQLRAAGFAASRSVLRNQVRKYAGLGQPDGRSCNVYLVTWSLK